MRDALSAPVEYDEQRHGYYYSKAYDFLPTATVTEAEMVALLVADNAIAQYRGREGNEGGKEMGDSRRNMGNSVLHWLDRIGDGGLPGAAPQALTG